jgi:hypothetical protein
VVVLLLGALGLLLPCPGELPAQPAEVPGQSAGRLDHPGLQETLLEGLAFLEDNQVRNRPGRGSSLRDSSDEGDSCRGRINVNLPCRENLGLPGGPVHNRSGEWASHINVLPQRLGFQGRP